MAKGRQEFRFVVNGFDFPEEQQQEVAAAVYKAAVGALAELDFRGDAASFFIGKPGRFDWDWAGGIWGPLDDLGEVLESVQRLGR